MPLPGAAFPESPSPEGSQLLRVFPSKSTHPVHSTHSSPDSSPVCWLTCLSPRFSSPQQAQVKMGLPHSLYLLHLEQYQAHMALTKGTVTVNLMISGAQENKIGLKGRSQTGVPRQPALLIPSPGNLSEKHILRAPPGLPESESLVGGNSHLCFPKPFQGNSHACSSLSATAPVLKYL